MIQCHELTRFHKKLCAVNSVTLNISRGEIFGLLGPNGAGKTTLIRLLTTLLSPTSGTALVDGNDITTAQAKVRRSIGFASQEISLDKELSCIQNLRIHALLHRIPEPESRIAELISWCGLESKQNDPVKNLSGGMQRILQIARSVIHSPKLLFLDEPSVGLDPVIRRKIWGMIKSLRQEGITILITTHYIEEAHQLCDRVGILNRGSLKVVESPQKLIDSVGGFALECSTENGETSYHLYPTREQAIESAQKFDGETRVRPANLEDVYIQLTGERL